MFSAATASLVLRFLPMLPGQILLNKPALRQQPTRHPIDHVDTERLTAPAHWDIAFIRRFMLFFGPLSSLFDFLTFWVMLQVFHAGPALFRSGWFVESLATQTLVIFAIRTRRVPFLAADPASPCWPPHSALWPSGWFCRSPRCRRLPVGFFAAMVVAYLVLIEFAKRLFFANPAGRLPSMRRRGPNHHIQRAQAGSATPDGYAFNVEACMNRQARQLARPFGESGCVGCGQVHRPVSGRHRPTSSSRWAALGGEQRAVAQPEAPGWCCAATAPGRAASTAARNSVRSRV